ncbi:prolyl oligopeptidase family serine peptidase [Asaia astilbis]|uniref:prolyl oligopeptidase family serine peptidase n=1 Tax=Asaia astilbis TaxID=610244 RepID=UPI0006860E5D|nr:prolyl oligopeptidase family serine peptidase [Asaia astilbis]
MRRILLAMTSLVCTSLIGTVACEAKANPAGSVPSRTVLEQVEGKQALEWVRAQNNRSAALLQADPRYRGFYDSVLAVEQTPGRLPLPDQAGGRVWNLWQDAAHPKGLWRVTTPASFEQSSPVWTTELDIDALAAQEKRDWVFQGAECLAPDARRCLITLSLSGEDAAFYREFDTATKSFVSGGFDLPHSKQRVAWLDQDTLLVSRDWGSGSMTRSGYPLSVRLLRRGQPLSAAREVYRGDVGDMIVEPQILQDGQGRQIAVIQRNLDFFRSEYRLYDPATQSLHLLALPQKIGFLGFYAGKLILRLDQDWSVGKTFKQGSIVAVDPRAGKRPPELLFAPDAHETTADIGVTAKGIIAVVYRDVQPSIRVYRSASDRTGWQETTIALPHHVSAELQSSDPSEAYAILKIEGYIVPPQLWKLDVAAGKASKIKETPALFDAKGLVTEQFWVQSSDGVKVPYFVTHRRDWTLNGHNPTLFTAYGGFDLSYLPTYYADVGKTWLERGGVYVVGNIRGGGEFGPAWHEAGMKSGRQHAYDDFAAIGRDLARRGIADRDHLGIRGRSNGGLLMGVSFTQHPELWKAVIIGVPLLDMENFETMAAGASWAAEYGHMAVSDERQFLERISPLQNLKKDVAYPVPFIFTSTKDDRVGPVHARLFAARLAEFGKPFFYYEDTEGGHAGTVNATEIAHERALEAVYLSQSLMDQKKNTAP